MIADMDEKKYFTDRLENQIDWYDMQSQRNQSLFKCLQLISILAAAAIPFLSGFITEASVYLKVITGMLGLLIAAITAVLGLYNFQKNWLQYRSTCESLKHEKFLFLTKAEPYDNEMAFKLLVQRVEGILLGENIKWVHNAQGNGDV